MKKIFISYSRKDKVFAKRLVQALERNGAKVWFDTASIKPGENWSDEVQRGLDACDEMILILSPDAMKSPNVSDEWEYYKAQNKRIIPVYLKSTQIHYRLAKLHYIDFYNESFQVALEELFVALDLPSAKPLYPEIDWCLIPGGEVNQDDKIVTVEPFYLAKIPITNLQYEMFVNAKDGYFSFEWWDLSIPAQQWRESHPEPVESVFNFENTPREMVNWYEATAFCIWLGFQIGDIVRLPTLYQRIRAVQGDDKRKYPWGNTFESRYCNSRIKHLTKSTTPVDLYPDGASPFGVMDLSGNVWEWSRSEDHDNFTDSGETFKFMFGGGWRSRPRHLRAAYPRSQSPDYRAPDVGFRVCKLI